MWTVVYLGTRFMSLFQLLRMWQTESYKAEPPVDVRYNC